MTLRPPPLPRRIGEFCLIFALGTGLGYGAALLGGPMPFMFGGILAAAPMVRRFERRQGPADRRLPVFLRTFFVALAGAMIGATFSPELIAVLPQFWITGLGILVFLAVAHSGSYVIMRRVGGFPPVDALFASMPGGLIEASILGEKAGADPRALAVQHFVRVLLVVMAVPLLFLLVTGETVGSAAGQSMAGRAWGQGDLALLVVVAGAGILGGQWARIPAGHLMGPLLICGMLHAAGVIEIAVPRWLLNMAQLVIGVSLGAQISGLTWTMLARGLKAGVVSVGYMMAVSLAFAVLLRPLVPVDTQVLFLSFAPGGVTEMSLIALSLHVSPVIVAMHHMVRIVATVLLTAWAWKRMGPRLTRATAP